MKIRAYADLHLYYDKDDMDRYNNYELNNVKKGIINNPPDLLVFCGDLCHRVYKSDDIRFLKIIQFITDIVSLCRAKGVLFRIIQGTSTHDGKIVRLLQEIFKDYDNVKCYTKCEYENINGYVFRFLPEPYYGDFIQKHSN